MQENLVGYLMNGLTLEETQLLEQALASDRQLWLELDLLRMALLPLEADLEPAEVPTGLAIRTCRHVCEFRNQSRP